MNIPACPRAAIVALVLISAACGGAKPSSPTAMAPTSIVPSLVPPPPPNFPPLSGPSRTFVFDHELSYHVRDWTRASRFVLYDDGGFVLQYEKQGEYRGGYTETSGVLTLEWEGWSAAGVWGATGTIEGNTLTVRYNQVMGLTDFEDAVYALAP
jgi:hypothetical protein